MCSRSGAGAQTGARTGCRAEVARTGEQRTGTAPGSVQPRARGGHHASIGYQGGMPSSTETPEKVNLKVEQGRVTRRNLLDAARRLFGEQGYEHVSAEELVAAAGVTRGALYHHFEDKQDLFRTLVVEVEEELDGRIRAAAGEAETPWGLLEDGVRAALEACLEPDIARIVMLDGPAVLGWDGWDAVDADFGIAQATLGLEVLQAEGVVAEQPIEPLARMVVALMNGACRVVAQSDDPRAAVDEVHPAVMTLLDGLRVDA
ncbi:hypothetical protein B7486_57375 [cyanobacterium TDX16]|nr:hypothetical protein B7486_57375 [cyanobacterium TDX16]